MIEQLPLRDKQARELATKTGKYVRWHCIAVGLW